MQRLPLLIWALVVGLAAGHLGSVLAGHRSCCRDLAPSENCCLQHETAPQIQTQSSEASARHACCPAPADAAHSSPTKPSDTHPHKKSNPHPCKCPTQCGMTVQTPVLASEAPALHLHAAHTPRVVPDWREPLPNPTLDRLKRPPKPAPIV